ncbi:YfjI family protein [Mycobacterium kansasii]|uniref:YfjI family protein n=1 Tax=Mycobacterium kansasii TaxID=1768 RepID=UPI0015E1CB44|nr:YfjI family protein [Mycobacterium kansasii]
MTSTDSTYSSTMGTRPADTSRNGDAATNGHHETQPAVYWSARQCAELRSLTEDMLDYPVFDDLNSNDRRELREAWRELCGEELDTTTTWNQLPVMPACVASSIAEKTLTRAEAAAYAARHGLEDPHVIADRLQAEGSLREERDRARVRALFASDPLPVTMAKVPPFPLHALPSVLADMAEGVARELGIDPAMAAVFGLGAVSGALCGRVVVQVHGNWIENGVSYTVVVDDSGGRKSPAFTQMLNDPLMAVQLELIERHRATEHEDIDGDGLDGQPVEMVGDEPAFAGPEPRLLASDVTTEQLGVLMAENRECMIVADAEGDVFDILSGRYASKGGSAPNLSLYLKSYSRERVDVDRASRGRVHLTHPALTLCLGTQPAVWHAVMANEWFAGKGFVARLEVAFPEPRLERAERLAALGLLDDDPEPVGAEVVAAYRTMIRELALGLWDSVEITAELTEAAQDRMKRHTREIDARRRADSDLGGKLSRWAAKCSGRVARRALHFHMAEHVAEYGAVGAAGMLIPVETVERAIEIEEWFIANEREAYGLADVGTDVNTDDVKAFVGWLIREHAKAPYRPILLTRILQNANPRCARQKSGRDKLVALLVDLNYLVHTKAGKKDAVYLNPRASDVL